MYQHLDLCSGIGGFALAVRWLGGTTIGFCEIEEYPQRVLRKNFPGVPIHDDLRTLTGDIVSGWGRPNLITAGYPCQPFSVAGQRRGENDDRHLWPDVRRIIAEVRPRLVLAENVYGHVNMGLDQVLSDLEAEGYDAGALVVPACAVDAPHRRDRVWVMAHANGDGEPTGPEHGDEGCGELGTHPNSSSVGRACEDYTIQAGRDTVVNGSWRSPQPSIRGVDDGLSPDVELRLRALGNAIVPQVAYELLRVMSLPIPDSTPSVDSGFE